MGLQPVARGPKVTRALKFCAPRKGSKFKIHQSSVGDLSAPQSLTHAAVARGPIWSCSFGPAVLHGSFGPAVLHDCTSLPRFRLPSCFSHQAVWSHGELTSTVPPKKRYNGSVTRCCLFFIVFTMRWAVLQKNKQQPVLQNK